jgi:serine/threonine protein kinase
MSLTAGSRLGPYEIVSPVGAGGMGEVYRANDTHLNRTVAIKVPASHTDQPSFAISRDGTRVVYVAESDSNAWDVASDGRFLMIEELPSAAYFCVVSRDFASCRQT